MTSYYSVIQYTPDPATGEFLNMGVLVWGDDGARCAFTNNWRRLSSVTSGNIQIAQEFAEEFQKIVDGLNIDKPKNATAKWYFERTISKFSNSHTSNFQFTNPRGSVKDLSASIKIASSVFLTMLPVDRIRRRTRSTAVSLTVRALRAAVGERLPNRDVEKYVAIKPELQGKLETHILDVGLRNGKLLSGAHALSFEGLDPRHLEREIESTAWVVEDIKKEGSGVGLALFALPPTPVTQAAYSRAEKIFRNMKIPLIEEKDLPRWAATQAEKLAQHVE